jgi:2-polyprenyl-3-methyl-5-hydroxy-6-metoxy-1,4-benzoquinol methylase
MTGALKLFIDVLALRAPPRALIWGLLNKTHFVLRTGNRRYEFERLYLETEDPWHYRTSTYERQKYEFTLAEILKWRRKERSALEIGCSIGVFTGMLAGQFAAVTAIDISREALNVASAANRHRSNVTLVHSGIETLESEERFDVIVCAEVLYYTGPSRVDKTIASLDRCLARDGIVVMVEGIAQEKESASPYFNGWRHSLGSQFDSIYSVERDDLYRPYRLAIYARSGG